ncbi:MAG TPA: farnesyl diphosphate synthase [Planctomycetota bacterium]|jgi:geranylgeranyl diphosphate synthase type II|nr:farnesyl diphosphate synthase [Planctomycetota bacterium]
MTTSAPSAFEAFAAQCRTDVETALDTWLPRPPDVPARLHEAMRYSLFAGGKRLRPVLTLAAADAVAEVPGDARRLALPVACALEMIHTYSLVHDDLPAMDDDTLRRGRPTSHVVFGEALAILAGDALLTEAFALVAREPETDDADVCRRKLRAAALVARAAGATGMVGGQVLDLDEEGQAHGDDAHASALALEDVHARKTGALIRAATGAGAIMAGADAARCEAIDTYARELGLCFQIVDDILDVEGSAEQLGKSTGKDAASGKLTYPSLFGIERSRALAAECADRARAALADAGLGGHLPAIVEWTLTRRQ